MALPSFRTAATTVVTLSFFLTNADAFNIVSSLSGRANNLEYCCRAPHPFLVHLSSCRPHRVGYALGILRPVHRPTGKTA